MDTINDQDKFLELADAQQMLSHMNVLDHQSIEEITPRKVMINKNHTLKSLIPFHIHDEILGPEDRDQQLEDAIYVIRDIDYDTNLATIGYQEFDLDTNVYIVSDDSEQISIDKLKRDVNFYPNLMLYSFDNDWANQWVKNHITDLAKLDFSVYTDDNVYYIFEDGPNPVKYGWEPLFEKMHAA